MDGYEALRRSWPLVVLGVVGCSNSFSPDPQVLGRWTVQTGTLSKGTLSPVNFAVRVIATQTGYLAAIPKLTWYEPTAFGAQFDTIAQVALSGNTFAFKVPVGPTNPSGCKLILFGGELSATKDSVPVGELDVYNPGLDTTALCFARGSVLLTKP